MKTIAYTALHYGRDYLGYAIQSVIDYVDEYWVLYSAIGSHGFRTDITCPETRAELYWIAQQVAGSKLNWVDGQWAHEGLQRDSITQYCPDADVIIVLDADEVWPKMTAYNARLTGSNPLAVSHYRVPIIHYWRSFYRAVLYDPAYPIRVLNPHKEKEEKVLSGYGFIQHMGYAQRPEIVKYKQETHGHRNEWRRDCNWFLDKFMANAQTDCHPVGSDYWQPEPVNPWDYMPDFMKSHPYANMEVIK